MELRSKPFNRKMSLVAARLAREYPQANRDHGVRVYTLTQGMLDEGTVARAVALEASAAIVLLIACANIANLLSPAPPSGATKPECASRSAPAEAASCANH